MTMTTTITQHRDWDTWEDRWFMKDFTVSDYLPVSMRLVRVTIDCERMSVSWRCPNDDMMLVQGWQSIFIWNNVVLPFVKENGYMAVWHERVREYFLKEIPE